MLRFKRILLLGSIATLTIFMLTELMRQFATSLAIAGGNETCFVNDGDTVYGSSDQQALQQAVDAALDNALLKVAGSCRGVQTRAGVTQTVYISKSLTLQGGYTLTNWLIPDVVANTTVLDAQNEGRVVYITGPVQISLNNLNILNGLAENGNGGGIYHNATLNEMGSGIYHVSSLTISHSTIANSTAVGSFPNGFGGGVAMSEGNLHLENSLITGSQAVLGGGLLIFLGQATVQNSSLINNEASESGGGIILGYGVLTMTNSTVAFNHAASDGGGIENDAESTVTLINR